MSQVIPGFEQSTKYTFGKMKASFDGNGIIEAGGFDRITKNIE